MAENARDQTLGVALLLHAPDIGFSYLEMISTALGRTGRGIGATLYERVREEARALGTQLYFESLPDDPALSPNPAIRAKNATRLKFYERYGARPIVNTAYETPVTPGTIDPPYLLLDPLGSNDLPSRDKVKKVVRAILERKYGLPQALCADGGASRSPTIRSACASRATPNRARAEGGGARGERAAHRARAQRRPHHPSRAGAGLCRGAGAHPLDPVRARRLGPVREDAGQALLRPAYPRRA